MEGFSKMNNWHKESIYKSEKQMYIERAKKMIDSGAYQGFTIEELARFIFDKDYD